MADDNSVVRGHLVSFSFPGVPMTPETVDCAYIENIVPNEASGGYTIVFKGGQELQSHDQVQLKVLKPYETEVCVCVCVCACVCVCVCVWSNLIAIARNTIMHCCWCFMQCFCSHVLSFSGR